LADVRFNEHGLVPVVTQQAPLGRVLMMAWADREALLETWQTGRATYFSRSRGRLWRKGEESGQVQHLIELRLDCDGDTVLYLVDQGSGMACHTGRESCFFRKLESHGVWVNTDAVQVSPDVLYAKRPS
jgi:phosphoribosyl-AMP cyclohydrolase